MPRVRRFLPLAPSTSPPTVYVYKGAKAWSAVYLGTCTDAQLYKGTGTLHASGAAPSAVEFSTASTDKATTITLSGTPKLLATGAAFTGQAQNVRTTSTASGKRGWEIAVSSYSSGDALYMGVDDGTVSYATNGYQGAINSNAVTLSVGDWGWEISYSSSNPQSNYTSAAFHQSGDTYQHEYDTATGSHSFFRIRSGVKTQLGSTVTGMSASFTHPFVGMKNGSGITANFGASAFSAALTSGYSAFNA
jgi:hypothetical protein